MTANWAWSRDYSRPMSLYSPLLTTHVISRMRIGPTAGLNSDFKSRIISIDPWSCAADAVDVESARAGSRTQPARHQLLFHVSYPGDCRHRLAVHLLRCPLLQVCDWGLAHLSAAVLLYHLQRHHLGFVRSLLRSLCGAFPIINVWTSLYSLVVSTVPCKISYTMTSVSELPFMKCMSIARITRGDKHMPAHLSTWKWELKHEKYTVRLTKSM